MQADGQVSILQASIWVEAGKKEEGHEPGAQLQNSKCSAFFWHQNFLSLRSYMLIF